VRVAGLIIAGGKALRMGSDKPFLPFCGGTLLDAVIARARPQVDVLMLNVRPDQEARCRTCYGDAYALVTDAFGGEAGPLGGVVAGLDSLSNFDLPLLATFPCDTPFIPMTMVSALQKAAGEKPAVIVASGEVQCLCALWPRRCLAPLRDAVASGAWRSVRRALDMLGAVHVELASPTTAFFNVNMPEDLAEAERLARCGSA